MFTKQQIDTFGDWSPVLYPLLSDKKLMGPIIQTIMSVRVRPDREVIFRAFKECKYTNLKVVIVGQDPYPDPYNAEGLAFSSQRITPSLRVIQDELYRSYDARAWGVTDLTFWSRQGVLLLNKALTCQAGRAGTHQELWQPFMERLVSRLNNPNLIWMLWGNEAQKLRPAGKVFTAYHPVAQVYSELRAKELGKSEPDIKFVGCNHFKLADDLLGDNKINWVAHD